MAIGITMLGIPFFDRLDAVGRPDAVHTGQHQSVDDAGGRRQQADHLISMIAMGRAARRKPVIAKEAIAEHKPRFRGGLAAEHRLERPLPEPTAGQRRSIVFGIGDLRADDAKATETVSQSDRNHGLDQIVAAPALHLRDRDVSRRNVHMVDAGQNELQRTAFGTDHQIEPGGIPRQALLELGTE